MYVAIFISKFLISENMKNSASKLIAHRPEEMLLTKWLCNNIACHIKDVIWMKNSYQIFWSSWNNPSVLAAIYLENQFEFLMEYFNGAIFSYMYQVTWRVPYAWCSIQHGNLFQAIRHSLSLMISWQQFLFATVPTHSQDNFMITFWNCKMPPINMGFMSK